MFDKWKHIETETFDRFKEARDCLEQVKLYKTFMKIDFQSGFKVLFTLIFEIDE